MCSLKNPKYILWVFSSLPVTAICQTPESPAYLPTVRVLSSLSSHREKRKCLFHPSLRISLESSFLIMELTRLFHCNKLGKSPIPILPFYSRNRPLLMSAWPTASQSKGCISQTELAILQHEEAKTGHPIMQ